MAKQKNGKKTECPLTREQFREAAKPLTLTIDGKSLVALEFVGDPVPNRIDPD
jgi:hypothetical protein